MQHKKIVPRQGHFCYVPIHFQCKIATKIEKHQKKEQKSAKIHAFSLLLHLEGAKKCLQTSMINRELIRLKTLQLVYAFYRSGGKDEAVACKELAFSLGKAYELYEYLLSTLVEVRILAEQRAESMKAKARRLNLPEPNPDEVLIAQNRLLLQLEENEALSDYRAKRLIWPEEPTFIARLLDQMVDTDEFREYAEKEADARDYFADREIIRKLYKTCVCQNEAFDDLIEDHSLYWNDDKEVIDSFVLKTIKRFMPDTPASWPLLPDFDTDDDRQFADKLFRETLAHTQQTRELIKTNCRNWDFDRLTFMDVVIMQQALSEILSFPDIPVNVTLNEYLNLAKVYSTPRSAPYINGLLDHIVKQLRAEHIIMK